MKKTLVILSILFLTGCASQSQIMVNQDTGKAHRCASFGWGWIGAPLSAMNQSKCVSDFKNMGFIEIEKAPVAGISFIKKGESHTEKSSEPAIITTVNPLGPAFAAGVKSGDMVIERDGEKITCIGDLMSTNSKYKIGDMVAYKVMRGDTERIFNIRLVSVADMMNKSK